MTTLAPGYAIPNSASSDLFGRFRIANPSNLFSAQFIYSKQPLLWDESTSGAGTSTFDSNNSCISLAVGTASGDRVIRQTKEYFAYEPDRAQQAVFTGVFGTAKANCKQLIGIGDDNNGAFIQLNGTTFGVVERTNTSGSPVDTTVTQTNFNIDKLDGVGPSTMTLDVTKAQIFFIEYQWLGVGSVRYGIYYDGKINYFHYTNHANLVSKVYMKRGSLPLRYEIVNTALTSGATTLTQICSSLQSEAGYSPTGISFAQDTGESARNIIGAGDSLPLLSIRLKSATNRATIIPKTFSVITDGGNDFRYQTILNGALTDESFTSVNSNSVAEYDISATALTGGTVLNASYVNSSVRGVNFDIGSLLKVVANIAGVADILTLYVTNISANINYWGSFEWEEYE